MWAEMKTPLVAEPPSERLKQLALSGRVGGNGVGNACGACGRRCGDSGGTDDSSSFCEMHPLALHLLSV
jgi:hypothetical protein